MKLPFRHKKKDEPADEDETKALAELTEAEKCAADGNDKCMVAHLQAANQHIGCPPCIKRIDQLVVDKNRYTKDQKTTKIHMLGEAIKLSTPARKAFTVVDSIQPGPTLSHKLKSKIMSGLKHVFIKQEVK